MIPREYALLPALSIRQPWAWAILHAGKDIENRNWLPSYRGKFLVHASKGMTRQEYDDFFTFVLNRSIRLPVKAPQFAELQRGGIVGVATVANCVRWHESPWFIGECGLVLENAKPLEFTPCAGRLGFFVPEFEEGAA